jgi:diaminohydroxyphosphoribosylaminopyrimidine deaminase / 5-amino-6-(5-phosphoribosylamino)uracil reductase
MSHAIEIAKKGMGRVSPNPLVGCILVKDGEIIGEGWHNEFGGPHAEVNAVLNSRCNPLDSIAYVTLEPCCHEGKTPPCVQFLYENGINEIFIGALDANPVVCGNGVKSLENLGLNVTIGVLEKEAEALNLGYNRWIKTGKPYVIGKLARYNNGFMGIDNKSQTQITGHYANLEVHELRANVDAIMVGKQTAIVDDPHLTVRHVQGENPIRVIIDTNRTIPLNLNVFRDKKAETFILCSNKKFDRHRTSFGTFIPVDENEFGLLSPKSILKGLGDVGVTSVLIEGGPKLLNSFLSLNLIDKFYEFISIENLENGNLNSPELNLDDWNSDDVKILGKDKLVIYSRRELCLQV